LLGKQILRELRLEARRGHAPPTQQCLITLLRKLAVLPESLDPGNGLLQLPAGDRQTHISVVKRQRPLNDEPVEHLLPQFFRPERVRGRAFAELFPQEPSLLFQGIFKLGTGNGSASHRCDFPSPHPVPKIVIEAESGKRDDKYRQDDLGNPFVIANSFKHLVFRALLLSVL